MNGQAINELRAVIEQSALRTVRIDTDVAGEPDVVIVASNNGRETIDLERYAAHPRRAKGNVVLRDKASFVTYVKAHSTPETIILADDRVVTAVLNHHEPVQAGALPGWSDYRATLELKYTPAWTGWTGMASQLIEQQTFAEWLEERALDVISPPGGELLELVTNLKAHMNVTFEKALNLSNGQVQLVYREELTGAGAAKGAMEIPGTFKLGLQVFAGGDRYEVTALLRWRLSAGEIKFMWKFGDDVQRLFEEQYEAMLVAIAAETELPVLRGRLS